MAIIPVSSNPDIPTLPIPLKVFTNLDNLMKIRSYKNEEFGLSEKSGIYGFINKVNGKQYIGSAKDLHIRIRGHLERSGVKSSIALQQAFAKYGKENFEFVVYAYVPYKLPAILDLESLYISYFPFSSLYNLNPTARLNIDKLRERLKANNNIHMPSKGFFGRSHSLESRLKVSRANNLNPMFGKNHYENTRNKLSSKASTPTYLYDQNKEYVLTFKNNSTLSTFFGCYKGTIGRYIKKKINYIKLNKVNFIYPKNTHIL